LETKFFLESYSGTEIKVEGEEHLIMREEDILGVIEEITNFKEMEVSQMQRN